MSRTRKQTKQHRVLLDNRMIRRETGVFLAGLKDEINSSLRSILKNPVHHHIIVINNGCACCSGTGEENLQTQTIERVPPLNKVQREMLY